jgi:hypothetical protein
MTFFQQHKRLLLLGGIAIAILVLLVLLQTFRGFLGARLLPVPQLSETIIGGRLLPAALPAGSHTLEFRAKTTDGKTLGDTVSFAVVSTSLQCGVSGYHYGDVVNDIPAGSDIIVRAYLGQGDDDVPLANATLGWSKRDNLGGLTATTSVTDSSGVAVNNYKVGVGANVIHVQFPVSLPSQGISTPSCDIFINAD